MSELLLIALVPLGVLLAAAALVVAIVALRSSRPRSSGGPLPTDLAGLHAEVGRLRDDAAGALARLAVVRYDAFGDMGGRLSWSVALADSRGDGIVITSIAGRSEARTYAKQLAAWGSDQPLSPEEEDAVAQARTGGGQPRGDR